jgi:hypothetical protein
MVPVLVPVCTLENRGLLKDWHSGVSVRPEALWIRRRLLFTAAL